MVQNPVWCYKYNINLFYHISLLWTLKYMHKVDHNYSDIICELTW